MAAWPRVIRCWPLLLVLGVVAVLFAVTLPRFKKLQDLVDRLNLVYERNPSRESRSSGRSAREKHEEQRFDKANKDFDQHEPAL